MFVCEFEISFCLHIAVVIFTFLSSEYCDQAPKGVLKFRVVKNKHKF